MANRVQERQFELVGPTVPIPRFRYTENGREDAGPPVPFPTEFVPDPASAICVIADEGSTALVDCPKGALLVDTSCEGAESLQGLWGHVVLVDIVPGGHILNTSDKAGIYAGRLHLEGLTFPTLPEQAAMELVLSSLTETGWRREDVGRYIEPKGMDGVSRDDQGALIMRWAEVRARAISAARLFPACRVVGEVKGRLSGRISRRFPATSS
jgi:hypothetical protein